MMKQFIHHLCAVVVCMAMSASLYADGLYLGYCDGILATRETGTVTGQTGADATVEAAIYLTPAQLKGYASSQITSVHFGLASGASAYPATVTGWVRADKSGENLASGVVEGVAGWSTISLDHALDISQYLESGVWVGFTFFQSSKLSVLAFLQNTDSLPNTGWIGKNGTWTDYSTRVGMLPIEAIVEGVDVPEYDLSLTEVSMAPAIVKIGMDFQIRATVRNNATCPAVNPVLCYTMADGKIAGTYTLNKTLQYRQSETVSITLPSNVIEADLETVAHVELLWSDGTEDQLAEDNVADLEIVFSKYTMTRRMLVEEATGSWCGWCVRGIVGLKEMREQYPDRFIGIGVHNGDNYTVTAYDNWMGTKISGYPSCLINRTGAAEDPGYDVLQPYMEEMNAVAEGDIELSATLQGTALTFSSKATFATSGRRKCHITYVVVEDKLPITQKNYYAGGGYGEMGGFENLGSAAHIDIDDVARGVYPSPKGVTMGLPSTVYKGEEYAHTLTVEMPEVANLSKVSVVAILTESMTGQVINATKGIIKVVDSTGVESLSAENVSQQVFNLIGQSVSSDTKGLVLINGRKSLRK